MHEPAIHIIYDCTNKELAEILRRAAHNYAVLCLRQQGESGISPAECADHLHYLRELIEVLDSRAA